MLRNLQRKVHHRPKRWKPAEAMYKEAQLPTTRMCTNTNLLHQRPCSCEARTFVSLGQNCRPKYSTVLGYTHIVLLNGETYNSYYYRCMVIQEYRFFHIPTTTSTSASLLLEELLLTLLPIDKNRLNSKCISTRETRVRRVQAVAMERILEKQCPLVWKDNVLNIRPQAYHVHRQAFPAASRRNPRKTCVWGGTVRSTVRSTL